MQLAQEWNVGIGYPEKTGRAVMELPHEILTEWLKELVNSPTRRERIATAAMRGMLAEGNYKSWGGVARDSTRLADTLITELEKNE